MEKEEEITNNLSTCYRCDTPLEPIPSEQWFLKMKELAKPAIETVKSGQIKFNPPRWKKPYLKWLENIHDWCISRQIWWGHKIPIEGETDVLDTWFSSALWPFATLGWPAACQPNKSQKCRPQKNTDLANFFPTSVLFTARDILYLWVARMIFSSMEFTGKIPFSEIYIHPTVFNKEGKRMSKSLGTGVDPLELIDKYGTDATRFGLIYQTLGNQDMRFNEDTMITGRKFCNKLWNATRFILMQLPTTIYNSPSISSVSKNKKLTGADKQIIKQLQRMIAATNKDLDNLRFGQPLHSLYNFFWHDFCDHYIETSKKQLADAKLKKNTEMVLLCVLVNTIKLFHPFIPFITEEIWQTLPIKNKKMLMIENWPI